MSGPLAESGFEVEETVLAGGREVVDEPGLLEVSEGRCGRDGFGGLEMEGEGSESREAADDGG